MLVWTTLLFSSPSFLLPLNMSKAEVMLVWTTLLFSSPLFLSVSLQSSFSLVSYFLCLLPLSVWSFLCFFFPFLVHLSLHVFLWVLFVLFLPSFSSLSSFVSVLFSFHPLFCLPSTSDFIGLLEGNLILIFLGS
jgi:hypothetical protein